MELASPFCTGSLRRLLWLAPNLESVGPLAAASNADLQSSPDTVPSVLGLLSARQDSFSVIHPKTETGLFVRRY